MTLTWIPTGDAARMLGYSPGHFRKKFEDIIRNIHPEGCYRKWCKEDILALLKESQKAS